MSVKILFVRAKLTSYGLDVSLLILSLVVNVDGVEEPAESAFLGDSLDSNPCPVRSPSRLIEFGIETRDLNARTGRRGGLALFP